MAMRAAVGIQSHSILPFPHSTGAITRQTAFCRLNNDPKLGVSLVGRSSRLGHQIKKIDVRKISVQVGEEEISPENYEDEIAPEPVKFNAESEVVVDGENVIGVYKENEFVGAAEGATDPDTSLADLKAGLIDTLYGTERGFKASSETRAEVLELIAQLESKNPTSAPTEEPGLFGGKWILAYTSFSELYPLLALGNLPGVKVGEISQTIDTALGLFVNAVVFSGPIASTTFSASADFEIRSAKRLQIKFLESSLGSPQAVEDFEVPDSLYILGQRLSISAFRSILEPLRDAALSIVKTLSGQPPLKFNVASRSGSSWLLTTFLDEDLRVSRGDGGGVFLLVKEGSRFASNM